jgi:peptidoglycan hydrolase-like protein with peptidoglycan-binding domain
MRITSSTAAFVPSSSQAQAVSRASLRRGSSGAEVLELQRSLAREGFDPGPLDGKFGAGTERAVRAFQRAQGLEVDGVVGRQTRAALAGGVVSPGPAPVPSPAPAPPSGAVTTTRSRTDEVGGVSTWKVQGKSGVAFKSGMSIDADGSPHAYNPSNTGLDALGNAGRPGNWWGLSTNSSGKPYVQGPNDPAPGYYVSTTALADARFPPSDPRRYVDSEKVPFIAIPPQLRDQGVKLGDLVAVRNERTGKTVFAVVADVGPRDHLGEGSIKLAQELGLNADARRGGAGSGISYVAFPNTKQAFPLTHEQIQAAGRQAYEAWGGDAQLASATR